MNRIFLTSIGLVCAVIAVSGCGNSKQEELARVQLEDRKVALEEKRIAQEKKEKGQKALMSKQDFNPFKD